MRNVLRYGDAIILEVIREPLQSPDKGIVVFGSESVQRTADRVSCNLRISEAGNLFITIAIASIIKHSKESLESGSDCIIEIRGGPGDEAPGEIIKYGGQISLYLRRTEMVFCADRNSSNILLFNHSEVQNLGREIVFKIMPKYKSKTYGEYVQYDDEMILMDFLGRPVSCEVCASGAPTIGCTTTATAPTAFRLRSFSTSDANVGSAPILQLGQVIRLRYIESGQLLAVHPSKYIADHAAEPPSDVSAYEGISDSCSALWELCSASSGESKDFFSADSKICNRGPLRLRQTLSRRYLTFNEHGSPELSPANHLGCEFQLHEVLSGRKSVDGDSISQQTKVMISHHALGLYVSLRNGQLSLSASGDGQVFQLSVADAMDSALLRTATFAGLALRSLPAQCEPLVYGQLAEFIRTLSSKLFGSELGGSTEGVLKARKQFVQLALLHMQFPLLLSDIAHNAFQSLQSIIGSEPSNITDGDFNELASCVHTLSAVYSLLDYMMSDFRPFADQILSTHRSRSFVSRLIQQQLYFDDLASTSSIQFPCKPPLAELLSCSKLTGGRKPLQLLDQPAISFLLDAVFEKIRQGKVPGEFPYRFLCQVCDEGSPYLQTSICRQLLGAASQSGRSSSSPFWSAMVYRTYLHREEKSQLPNPSLSKGRPKIRLMICTSFFGQCRPTLLTDKVVTPVQPPDLPQGYATSSEEYWTSTIAERNATTAPPSQPSPSRSSALLDDLAMRIEWKDIQQLSTQEAKFYCASLQLLASLCSGRNMRTQTIIRQLLPVDHILQALLISGSDASLSLLHVQAGFARLLRQCYVDSAVLHPLSSNGALDSKSNTVSVGEGKDEQSWMEVFEEECYSKVLCQSSQLSDGLFEVADDMTETEHQAAVRLLRWPCYSDAYSNIPSEQLGVDALRALRDGRKAALAAENVHSVEQRAILLSIMVSFVSFIPVLWNTGVEQTLWKLFLQQRDSRNSTIDGDSKRVNTDLGQQLIAARISFVQEMITLMHSLLLRKFFDDNYNCNPTFSPESRDSDAESKAKEFPVDSLAFFYDLDALGEGFEVRDILDCCDRKVRVVRYMADRREEEWDFAVEAGFLRALVHKMFAVLKAFPSSNEQQLTAQFFSWRFHCTSGVNARFENTQTLCQGAVEVKALCCKILHLCMDRYFSFTVKILRTIIYEPVIKKAISEKKSSIAGIAEIHVIKKFQERAWKKLETVRSNRNLLWTVTEFFREESFLTLLHLMYFDDNRLRQQVMNLIFRVNSARSELATTIIDTLAATDALLSDLWPDEASDRQHHILPQYLNILGPGGQAEEELDKRVLTFLAIKKLFFQKSSSTVDHDTLTEVAMRKRGLIELCSTRTEKAEYESVKIDEFSSIILGLHAALHGEIFSYTIHYIGAVYRQMLIMAGYDQLLLSFLFEHGQRYVQFVAGKSKERAASRAVELDTISLCCKLFRMVLRDVQEDDFLFNGSAMSLPQLLLLLCPYCKDAVYLLIDLVSLHPVALRCISGDDFDALLIQLGAHIRETYAQNEERESKSSVRTMDIASTLCILTLHFPPASGSSRQNIVRLISFLQSETAENLSLTSLILQLGFGTADLSELSSYAMKQSKGGYAFNGDPVESSSPGEEGPMRFMCNRYLVETDRATFWRSPQDILTDPLVDCVSAVKWQSLFRSAKLLSRRSKLLLHLNLIIWIGTMSALNTEIRALSKRSFDSLSAVVNVLFIDQIEIRFAYVVLLRGLWLWDAHTEENVTVLNTEWEALSVEQGKAMLYSFLQDLKIFYFLSCENGDEVSEPKPVQLKKHSSVYERYIEFGVLPCLSSLLSLASRGIGVGNGVVGDESRLQELYGSIVTIKAIEQLIDQYTAHSASIKPGLIIALCKARHCIQKWFATDAIESPIVLPIVSDNPPQLSSFFNRRQFSNQRLGGLSDQEFMEQSRSIFLVAVDDFSQEFGYHTDHLVALKEATVVYVDGRELVWDERSQLKVPRSSLIRDPLNNKSFKFTSQILSKHVYSYCRIKFSNRFADLEKEVALANKLSDFHLEFWADSDLIHRSQTEAAGVLSLFHNSAFLKWAEHGGLLVKMILKHVQQNIESAESKKNSRERTLLIRTNGYWMDVFCKGVLRTILQDIYNAEDMTENVRALLVATERSRLRLLQDALQSFGAVSLAVHHWLKSVVADVDDAQSDAMMMHYGGIALAWGIALLETGNTAMQISFADALRVTENDFVRTFLSFLRLCRRNLSSEFSQGNKHSYTVEMGMTITIRLLRFLSLLCEGNNYNSQLFLLDCGVVVEVAMFIEEVTAVLSQRLSKMLKLQSFPVKGESDDVMGGSAIHVIQWLDSAGRLNFDLGELLRLIEVVQQGFDTLTEFCQGFMFKNQVAITSAGAIKHIGVLIQFCGSFQYLCAEETSNLSKVDNRTRKVLQTFFTHESSVKAPSGDLSSGLLLKTVLPVCGSDPLTLALRYPDLYKPIDGKEKQLLSQLCDSKKRFMDHQGGINALSVREMDDNPYNIISNKLGQALWQLEDSTILLLQSLSEGSVVDSDSKHCSAIVDNLPLETLLGNMHNYWRRFQHYRLDGRYPNPGRIGQQTCYERSMALKYYIFCRRLCDMPSIDTSALTHGSKRIFKELNVRPSEHVARIEVREPTETGISVTYFPIPLLVCRNWRSNIIAQLKAELLYPLDEVLAENRLLNSAEDKMKQFLREGAFLVDTLRHMQFLLQVSKSVPILYPMIVMTRKSDKISLLVIALTIVLNILMILSVQYDDHGADSIGRNNIYSTLMRYFGIACLTTCALAFCCFVLLYLKRFKFDFSQNHSKKSSAEDFLSMKKKKTFSFTKTLVNPATELLRLALPLLQPMSLVVFSAFGVFYSPLWFSLCLSELVIRSRAMQRLWRAVYLRLQLLLALCILALLLSYAFAVGAYSTSRIQGSQNYCKSLRECALGAISIGLWLEPLQLNYTVEDTLFNFAFVVILQAVVPALLVAVLAESFWSLQTQQRTLERQVQSSCFICSLKRDDLEYPGSSSFSKHTTGEHNMWQYLWFIVYLEEKDPTQLSGVELFCKANIHSARWLPTRMARRLQPMCMPTKQQQVDGETLHDNESKQAPTSKRYKDGGFLNGLRPVMKSTVKISPEIQIPN